MKAHQQNLIFKTILGAVAGLALFIALGERRSALGQTNTFPSSGNVGIGTLRPQTRSIFPATRTPS